MSLLRPSTSSFPFVLHEKFYVLVCDEKDNEVLAFITPNGQLVPAFSTIEDQHRTVWTWIPLSFVVRGPLHPHPRLQRGPHHIHRPRLLC